jgi:hypothetical protein
LAVHDLGVSAIDKIEPLVWQIETRVARRHKTFETDELLGHFGMNHGDDVGRLGEGTRGRRCHQSTEGTEKLAFGRGPEEGSGNAFTHDIAHQHIEVLVVVAKKVVEVAVDLLRRQRQGGNVQAGHIIGLLALE